MRFKIDKPPVAILYYFYYKSRDLANYHDNISASLILFILTFTQLTNFEKVHATPSEDTMD